MSKYKSKTCIKGEELNKEIKEYSKFISKKTKEALKNKKNRQEVYNHTPYGFKAIEGKLSPDVEEQKIIKRIISLRNQGYGYTKIANDLNKNNIPSKRGGNWYPQTIKQILGNNIHRDYISERTKDAINFKKDNKQVYSQCPLGYLVDDKGNLIENTKEQETITYIKSLRSKGLSLSKIANHLNKGNIPTKKGGKWASETIRKVLENTLHQKLIQPTHMGGYLEDAKGNLVGATEDIIKDPIPMAKTKEIIEKPKTAPSSEYTEFKNTIIGLGKSLKRLLTTSIV